MPEYKTSTETKVRHEIRKDKAIRLTSGNTVPSDFDPISVIDKDTGEVALRFRTPDGSWYGTAEEASYRHNSAAKIRGASRRSCLYSDFWAAWITKAGVSGGTA